MLKKLNSARAKLLRRGSSSSVRSIDDSSNNLSRSLHEPVSPSNEDSQPRSHPREEDEAIAESVEVESMATDARRGASLVDPVHQPQHQPQHLSRPSSNSIASQSTSRGTLKDSTALLLASTHTAWTSRTASIDEAPPAQSSSIAVQTDEEDAELDHDTVQALSAARRERILNLKSQASSAGQFRHARPFHEYGTSHSRTSSRDVGADEALTARQKMIKRIWVKRPGASPTMIKIQEDFLVDDVRDLILTKYRNSLGRNFDAPDIVIRIMPRDKSQRTSSEIDRALLPDESIVKTIDLYYPNGQSSDEALLIDIPHRRTPRASPAAQMLYSAGEGGDYFSAQPTPNSGHLGPQTSHYLLGGQGQQPHSISILTTGNLPPMPLSPGVQTRTSRRPKARVVPTSSPVLLTTHSSAQDQYSSSQATRSHGNSGAADVRSPPAPLPLQTPPVIDASIAATTATTPPARVASPRPKVSKKAMKPEYPALPHVPPISVLIVEDNMINLRLLEAMVKRLKIRWDSAVNGKQAVDKWRGGGFHLVLMDLQLPIMSGIQATKEIRRLERVNNIGVFNSMAASGSATPMEEELTEGDKLDNLTSFKSPVIIVALTASSLQSDRHEALAAGCNDFLTKPVKFDWLERKVLEWGCMQAMIDFSGWRKWRELANGKQAENTDMKVKSSTVMKAIAA